MRSVFVFGMAMVFAGAAVAEDYPDMRGTWTGTTESVRIYASQFYAQREGALSFSSGEVAVTIEHQEGRRLAGSLDINGWIKPIVGAFTDTETIQWVEPGGIVEARILGADSLDYCYFRLSQFQQLASCATLEREGS